jgi:ribosomal protein S27E
MAGYGGASAPTSRSGGAVIQAESLEQGRPGFKYVTCNNCGKEQVHAKYQVKCRECGHGMSFEKLYDAMRGNK